MNMENGRVDLCVLVLVLVHSCVLVLLLQLFASAFAGLGF